MRALLASDEPRAHGGDRSLHLSRRQGSRRDGATRSAAWNCLVFTGGIGERSPEIRRQICDRLQWLGVRLDPSANDRASERAGADSSQVDILIIPTSEEMTIARHCAAKLSEGGSPGAAAGGGTR